MKYSDLLEKYDVPTPRYTSYPTVPFWDETNWNSELWIKDLQISFEQMPENEGISLYIHLPFCETLCTYCGCNKRITKNHQVEKPYIDAVLEEWKMYKNLLPSKPRISEIHLGGGTPTFFSPENLKILLSEIISQSIITEDFAFSVEVHPNYTSEKHLEALYQLGFKRISLGVQDFDPKVQFVINRIQTFEQTKKIFDAAKSLGFDSINVDLVYGLPLQTLDSVEFTISKINELKPDRIAFYSYAHVPWKSKSQRRYDENDLPSGALKRQLFETGVQKFLENGYVEVGMDHFALPSDEMAIALKNNTLHRNFMGYTARHVPIIIGLGVSSISDSWTAFAQNEKEVEAYYEKINAGVLPVIKGHHLTTEDLKIRQEMLQLMCQFEVEITDEQRFEKIKTRLQSLLDDKCVELNGSKIMVTELGKSFVRNIAMCLDERYFSQNSDKQIFSKSI